MKFLFSNFFKFIKYELKGPANQSQINIQNKNSERNESLNSSKLIDNDEPGDHVDSPRGIDQNLYLDLKSLKKNSSFDSTCTENIQNITTDSIENASDHIPKNFLSHMARLPYLFEILIFHSVGICLDSVLFELTFIPIQAVTTLSHLISKIAFYFLKELKFLVQNELLDPVINYFTSKGKPPSVPRFDSTVKDKDVQSKNGSKSFHSVPTSARSQDYKWNLTSVTLTEVCGCVRFFVLVTTIYIFSHLDTSKVYHNIKGQPVMKLYVIFNMLEVCERLTRSFSRDVMDSLIRNTIRILVTHLPEQSSDSSRTRTSYQTKSVNYRKIPKRESTSNYKREEDPKLRGSLKPGTEDSEYTDNMIKDSFVNQRGEFDSVFGFGNSNFGTILDSCRRYSDRFNIYYKFVFLYFFVVMTISFHTFLHLVRFLSLNIAINSPESTMFLLLITNNFAEIKSTVFKRYDPVTLFVIFASDAVERCYLFFDGLLVILKMSTSKRHTRSLVTVLSWLAVIYGIEILVDLVKHGYLIKFNKISSNTFEKYNLALVCDTLLGRSLYNTEDSMTSKFNVPCKGSFSFSHISSRRLGFLSSPITVLIVCSLPRLGVYLSAKTVFIASTIWLSLVLFKFSTSTILTGHAIKKNSEIINLEPSFYSIGAL